jgi:hypothetical protein
VYIGGKAAVNEASFCTCGYDALVTRPTDNCYGSSVCVGGVVGVGVDAYSQKPVKRRPVFDLDT